MRRLIHELLEDDERGRDFLAYTGIFGGTVLLGVAVFATFALR